MKYKVILIVFAIFLTHYAYSNEVQAADLPFFNDADLNPKLLINDYYRQNYNMNITGINIYFSINFLENPCQQNFRTYNDDSYWTNFDNVYEDMKKYDLVNTENPFRRASILFFGSLTFATFGGWLFMSIYDVLVYGDVFGNLRREQFLLLYLGSSIISFSVVLSDLFANLDKNKKGFIQFY